MPCNRHSDVFDTSLSSVRIGISCPRERGCPDPTRCLLVCFFFLDTGGGGSTTGLHTLVACGAHCCTTNPGWGSQIEACTIPPLVGGCTGPSVKRGEGGGWRKLQDFANGHRTMFSEVTKGFPLKSWCYIEIIRWGNRQHTERQCGLTPDSSHCT